MLAVVGVRWCGLQGQSGQIMLPGSGNNELHEMSKCARCVFVKLSRSTSSFMLKLLLLNICLMLMAADRVPAMGMGLMALGDRGVKRGDRGVLWIARL